MESRKVVLFLFCFVGFLLFIVSSISAHLNDPAKKGKLMSRYRGRKCRSKIRE